MGVFRFLLEHKVAVLLVLALLCCQAACDLSLPMYTSDIVDIGIQQSGVEHVTAEVMSAKTYDELEDELEGESLDIFKQSYFEDGDIYRLNDFGRDHIEELDEMLAYPLIRIHSGDAKEEDGDSAGNGSGADVLNELQSEADTSLLKQQAIKATISEYEAAGYNLSDMQMGYLVRIGLIMLLITFVAMAISIAIGFIASKTGASIGRDLRERLFSRVVSYTESEIDRFSAASLITRATNDITLIQNVSIMFLRMVLNAPIIAIGGIIMVVLTSPQMGWIVVVAVCVVFIVIFILFKVTMPKFKIMQRLIDRVNLIAREILTGMPVIRAYGREGYEEKRFDGASLHLMKTQLFTNRAMAFMMPTITMILNLVSVAIVWFGGFAVQSGQIQTGDLIAFITYAMVIIMGFLMLGMIAIMLPRANVAAERIAEVLKCKPSVVDSPCPQIMETDTQQAKDDGASVVFDDVSFCYAEDEECEDVLKHVSFKVEPGQTFAIIGATGSGKSTILKLIERFYDVDRGTIRLDGTDIRDMPQAYLRAQIGYVPQKAFLFSGTVASNVAYSNPEMDVGDIEGSLDIAQAAEFVDSRDGGLDSPISQGGANVSGGQRQRLAIARAIATHARLFMFDDSFSALDYKTDAALREQLRRKLDKPTLIIVAQRISTIMHADNIIVLDDGEIVGSGTHEELLSSCKVYQEIALSQLSEEELGRASLQESVE